MFRIRFHGPQMMTLRLWLLPAMAVLRYGPLRDFGGHLSWPQLLVLLGEKARAGTEHGKKDLFEIWRAHRPAYLATVSPRFPIDLTNKFLKAKGMHGPKLFIAHAPCPTGWLYDPQLTADYARSAVETGIFALKEIVDGKLTHTYVPRRHRPVEEYLQGQGRYRHLFEPVRNEAALQHIQDQVDRYWAGVTEKTGAAR